MEPTCTRRDSLRIALAASALTLLGACRSSNPEKEFAKTSEELTELLERVAKDDVERVELASVARRIRSMARELINDHRQFLTHFDQLTANADVATPDIRRVGERFLARRTKQRDDLLRLQGELRTRLQDEEWDEAVEIMSRRIEAGVALRMKEAN